MLCRGLVGASFRPLRLELAYPAPAYAQEYEALFECEVRLGMPRNRELIDPAWLSRRLPAWNPVSAQQELALCRPPMPRGRAREATGVGVGTLGWEEVRVGNGCVEKVRV